ncbi:hypothetical protein M514_02424 [Trichuris suis]|uniref:Uncharacterized protein n=1 Tax=Trichuris suis TaxID=68888 RepID=A0A085MHQ1_9BILA|nr:hypothetical protein M513_02424 [Trichuris suis]KFD64800.1 hypothetical protein M514_02424 [Trichuris suis]
MTSTIIMRRRNGVRRPIYEKSPSDCSRQPPNRNSLSTCPTVWLSLSRPGTPVYVKCEVRDKLQPKWGPGWTVIQQYESGTVRLLHDTGIEKVLHLTKVRPLCPRPAQMSSLEMVHVPLDPLHGPPDASTSRPQRHRRPPV